MEVELELPSADERERLLDGLTRLVRQRGFEQLVGHPVLLPQSKYFPDSWEEGPRGVVALVRRLLHYAGLEDFRVHVTVYDNEEHTQYDTRGVGHGAAGAAAWFAGIDGKVCRFGVERRELRHVDELIGTLGHEVAHAYRAHHSLIVSDSRVEEQLTDLTAVYLGFGVFLLNSSSSFRTGGYSESGQQLLWEKRARGYLTPARIAFLLATQNVVRNGASNERRRIAQALAPNHRKLFLDACELLAVEPDILRGRVEVPDPHDWPEWPTLDVLVPALDPNEDDEVVLADEKSTDGPAPATRVVTDRSMVLALAGAGAPFLVASFDLVEGVTLLGSSVVGAVVGWVSGRILSTSRCSACKARVARADSVCPDCHAPLAREHAEPSDDAELAYDWHTDPKVSEDERNQARLLSAMFLAWAIERDLVSLEFREGNPELVEGVRAQEPDSHVLYAAWIANKKPFNASGAAFADQYLDADGVWPANDYLSLMTAELKDTHPAYARVAAMLDRRFQEFEERA